MLARKLALSDEPVPVEPAWLRDFDVVYSAHISPYGAVPATLQRSPGTVARVRVAYLTRAQLTLISATEPNYELAEPGGGRLPARRGRGGGGAVRLPQSPRLSAGERAPRSRSPPSRLAAGGFASCSEPQVLEHVRGLLCPAESIEAFVLGCVADPALAAARTAQLERRALLPG